MSDSNDIPFRGRSAHRATMADVARLAGVTPGTVSRALAGSTLVTPETRAKVTAAVQATGYVVNQAARSLRENRSRQILVALPNIANPFFAQVVAAVEQVAQEAGYAVLISNTGNTAVGERRVAQILLKGAVDGLIVHTGRLPADLAGIPDIARRVVAVAAPLPGSEITSVVIDECAAAREAASYLIGLGHRTIAHIGGPPSVNSEARRRGYCDALVSAGMLVDEALIGSGNNTIASGQEAARIILSRQPRPTAVFCANDEMAIGTTIVAKEMGLRVPDDVSIVGFDDVDIAAYYDPPLTTVRLPRDEIGRTGMKELLALLDGKRKRTGRRIVLPHLLVVRQSTRNR